jgi:ankyrin repeat protein
VLSLCDHGTQRSLTLFIDALDECDEQQAIDMVQYFEELAEECTDNGIPFRICFSSRHYPYITVRRGIELTLEAQAGHTEDLVGYIGNRLRIQNAVLAKELQAQIINKAGGIFLWVILVVDILNQEDANGRLGLRKRLDEIPDDLHTLFKSILMRDEEHQERLLLGILWILFSARPLGPEEYYHALWAGLLPKGLVDTEMPPVNSSDSQDVIHRFIISSTKGFAETTKGNEPTVQFIHESVRDFLIKDRGIQQLWPDHGSDWQILGQDRLKESCMTYLKQKAIHDRLRRYNPGPSRNASELESRFPFLGYAAQHVLYHANIAADAVSQDNFISCFPLDHWVKIVNLFEKYATRQYAPTVDLLYVLAERGHAALIRTRLRASPNINVTDGGRYNHPLFAALAHRNKECVAALLGSETYLYNGVDITEGLKNQKDLKDYRGRTPLTWAAQEGRLELMELLIQKGASLYEQDEDNHHPLCRAMHFRQVNAITMLIKMGADIGWKGCFVYVDETLLTWASSCGYVGMMQLLLDRGAVIHEKDRSGRTALCAALEAQEDESIKFLIKKGADIHACEKHGLQLLGRSVLEPHLELFETVLVQGSILSKMDEEGRRFLSQSSLPFILPMFDPGHRGVGRCCEFTEGWTLLGLAAKKKNLPLLELLIRRGADINMSANGYTPLGWAVHNGSESLCRRLIEAGADVNVKGPTGLTPLIMAMNSYFPYEAIAVLLINNGASLNSYDIFGEPPLVLAARRGSFRIAKALVEKGADLSVKGVGGSTPLEGAKHMKFEKIVNLLAAHEGAK